MESQLEVETVEPRYGRANLNGVDLAWADWGESDTPADRTLVAAHGITGNLHTWDALAPALVGAGYRLIGYDLRGRGESGKPATGYDLAHHAADLLALLDYFKLAQANIVGHSLGALIGLYFTSQHPQRVRRLVLVDHGHDTAPDAREAIAMSLARLGRHFETLDDYLNLFRGSPLFARWTPAIEQFYSYDAKIAPDGSVMSKISVSTVEEELANLPRPEFLPTTLHAQIARPTLILRAEEGTLDGGKRGFILTAESADAAAAAIPEARHVPIAGVNHYTIALDPTPPVAQAMIDFLA